MRLKGEIRTVRVSDVRVDVVSDTHVFVEGRDHAGTVVVVVHLGPDEARDLCAKIGVL